MILAGVDIGTNTIRLLVAETGDSIHKVLYSGRVITRLGQGLDRTGALAPDAQERSLAALEEFAAIIRKHAVAASSVVGTSALRNASNAAEFIAAVRQRTGLEVMVISGDDEARLTLLGVRRALARGKAGQDPLASSLVVDIGGGSTELMAIRQGRVLSMESLPLGAVYLTERHINHDPPSFDEITAVRSAVRKELEQWQNGPLKKTGVEPAELAVCAGTAGTITTLAAMDQGLVKYDPDRVNGYVLQRNGLDRMVYQLASAAIAERKKIPGLEPGREDIILAGAIIVQEVMARCIANQVLVSDWGLREGIIFDLYGRSIGEEKREAI